MSNRSWRGIPHSLVIFFVSLIVLSQSSCTQMSFWRLKASSPAEKNEVESIIDRPTFLGIKTINYSETDHVYITWNLAEDKDTPQSEINYDICYSDTVGRCSSHFEAKMTIKGMAGAVVSAPDPGLKEFLVRARNSKDNRDENQVVKRFSRLSLATSDKIALGTLHNCILKDGEVLCWGDNRNSELGLGDNIPREQPTKIPNLSGVTNLFVGSAVACALKGTDLYCWGANTNGMLGFGHSNPVTVPTRVPGVGPVKSISLTSTTHACLLLVDGTAMCSGSNSEGQFGNGGTTSNSSFVAVPSLTNIRQIEVSPLTSTCALLQSGQIKCWGRNFAGQLGNGNTLSQLSPVDVLTVTDATHFAIGNSGGCAVLSDSRVKCWGGNGYGGLGDGTNTSSSTPIYTDSSLGLVSKVVSGIHHRCALLMDKTVKCWGQGYWHGQIGDGKYADKNLPTLVPGLNNVEDIIATDYHNVARLTNGELVFWGRTITGSQTLRGPGATFYIPVEVSELEDAQEIRRSLSRGGCVIRNDGRVGCWGNNEYGQMGIGVIRDMHSFVPEYLPGFTAKRIATASTHVCAVDQDDLLRCWGRNNAGQLGNGNTTNSLSPIVISGLSGVIDVSMPGDATCVLLNTGLVKCWGTGSNGRLGNGASSNSLPHVNVSTITQVVSITSGSDFSCALRQDKTVWCWGTGTSGQLGNGVMAHSNVPVQVSDLSNVTKVMAYTSHACALLEDKSLYCWGANSQGQLAQAISTGSAIPLKIEGLGEVRDFNLTENATCAGLANGRVKCWGSNWNGVIGADTETLRSVSPIEIPGLDQVTSIYPGTGAASCAKAAGGKTYCWGAGPLGFEFSTHSLTPMWPDL